MRMRSEAAAKIGVLEAERVGAKRLAQRRRKTITDLSQVRPTHIHTQPAQPPSRHSRRVCLTLSLSHTVTLSLSLFLSSLCLSLSLSLSSLSLSHTQTYKHTHSLPLSPPPQHTRTPPPPPPPPPSGSRSAVSRPRWRVSCANAAVASPSGGRNGPAC